MDGYFKMLREWAVIITGIIYDEDELRLISDEIDNSKPGDDENVFELPQTKQTLSICDEIL